jgi:PhnB protein
MTMRTCSPSFRQSCFIPSAAGSLAYLGAVPGHPSLGRWPSLLPVPVQGITRDCVPLRRRMMSIQLRIGDWVLHLADELPEMGVLAPTSIGGTPVVLGLEVADADPVFAQAIAAGATVRQRLGDTFWGDRHGQLDDPFGHRWNVTQHLRDVPHDEIVAAAAQLFG